MNQKMLNQDIDELQLEIYALSLELKTLKGKLLRCRSLIASINMQLPPLQEEVGYHIPVQKLQREDDWLQNWYGAD